MPPVVLNGPQYLAEGLKLMLRPGLRLFVLLPLLVNLLVFGGLIMLAVQQFGGLLDQLMNSVPDWLSWLNWLLWPLFGLEVATPRRSLRVTRPAVSFKGIQRAGEFPGIQAP